MSGALSFENVDEIGHVAGVDTSKVAVDIVDEDILTRITIGQMVAIQGVTELEHLIGIVDRVTRGVRDSLPDPNEGDELFIGTVFKDSIRVVLIGTYRSVDGSKKNTFKRGADSFPQINKRVYNIQGKNLQRFMSLLSADIPSGEQLKLGAFVSDANADAIASGDKFFQRHAAILGSTGSGKSWAVALILERSAKLKYPNIVVFDMHGEYSPLADVEKGGFARRYRIAGPADLEKDDDDLIFLPYWLLNRDEMLSMILDRSDQNAPNQASRFTSHVRELKDAFLVSQGRDAIRKTFTVDSPIPYEIDDLVRRLDGDDTAKKTGAQGREIKGDWEGKLTRFVSRLKARLEDRRYGFMFQPTKSALHYDWLSEQLFKILCSDTKSGIKIVDFSEVPSDILPVVTGTFARLIFDVQFWMQPSSRTPVAIFCDEAHLYLPVKEDADSVEKQALRNFERIAKEGRKYGLSLVVVSQRPADVSKTILSQCNNFLALRLTNDTDQSVVKRLVPDAMAAMTDLLPLLDVGEAFLLGDAVLLPTRIRLDAPAIQPNSATRPFWKEWSSTVSQADAIRQGIENLRGQTRLPEIAR